MLAGFYSSATGMISQTIAMDHITENISNANVAGYKKQEVIFHSFDNELKNEVLKEGVFSEADHASGIDIIQGVTDFSQGSLRYTGNKTDVALEGSGFFKVDTGDGQFYTRNGKFAINNKYELVTKEGFNVLTKTGEKIFFNPQIPNVRGTLQINEMGDVIVTDNRQTPGKVQKAGTIGIFDFEDKEQLTRVGFGLWENKENEAVVFDSQDTLARQEYEELSNAKPVESMVEMIYNQRLYDANANALKTLHSTMKDFISQILS